METEPLEISLELAVGNNVVTIPAGSIKGCQLSMGPLGYRGEIEFWQAFDDGKDDVIKLIKDTDPMSARLSICTVLDDPKIKTVPLVVQGLVTAKSYREVVQEQVNKAPVLQRHYTLSFRDIAQILWKQHFPAVLLADSTITDLIKGVTVKGVSLNLDWSFLEEARTVSFLPCGNDVREVSFYDWLLWLAENYGAHLYYDYLNNRYTLSSKKEQKSKNKTLRLNDIESVIVHLPEECRHNIRILNAYSEKPASDEVKQDRSVAGCRRDIILRAPVESDYSDRKTLEKKRLVSRGKELEIPFQCFPAKAFAPNDFIDFSDEFSSSLSWSSGSYRVVTSRITISATEQEAEKGKHDRVSSFNVSLVVTAEEEDNEYRHIPNHEQPHYPVYVEGKIMSDKGELPDKTYELGKDAQSKLEAYKVKIPLWNQDLSVEFSPNTLPGHFYFPAFKGSRVLVSLWFDHARIESFLDFGSGTALPQDSQGNHILFGPNGKNETSMRHEIVDKKPTFSIKRICDEDTELVKLEEGTILLQTKEEEQSALSTETFDLTPKVALAKSSLAMAKEEGVGSVTTQFESTSSEVTASINEAVGEAATQLEVMDAQISGKIGEVEAQVNAAMSQIGDKTEEMSDKAKEAKNELLERLKL